MQKTINGAAFIQISDSQGIRGYRSTTPAAEARLTGLRIRFYSQTGDYSPVTRSAWSYRRLAPVHPRARF